MADIEKLEKQAEADKDEIVEYKQMHEQLNKKARLLYEENKSIKKLAKLPLDDKFARKVAKKQLLEEEKHRRRKNQFSWSRNISEYFSREKYEEENHKYSSDHDDEEEEEREKYMRQNDRKRKQ